MTHVCNTAVAMCISTSVWAQSCMSVIFFADYYNQIRSAIELLKKEGNTTEDAVSTTNKETIVSA